LGLFFLSWKLLLFVWKRGTTPMKVRARLAATGWLKDVDAYLKQASSLEFGLLFVGWMDGSPCVRAKTEEEFCDLRVWINARMVWIAMPYWCWCMDGMMML
jgi:hypothetical protein